MSILFFSSFFGAFFFKKLSIDFLISFEIVFMSLGGDGDERRLIKERVTRKLAKKGHVVDGDERRLI